MDNNRPAILVVDDEKTVRDSLERVLTKENFRTFLAANASEAESVFASENIALVLTDLQMPEVSGIELLKRIKRSHPDTEVILITGHGTVERAVEAMKEGAYDFVAKPFKRAEILRSVHKALEKRNILQENLILKEQLASSPLGLSQEFIGQSSQVKEILSIVDRVAPISSTVLITGESGTGKEIIARMIHAKSTRNNRRFVAVNCGAIAENLIESELFGHVKGAFTGAIRAKDGLFKIASEGTLFLDEISTIPLNLQVKLLRALESHEIMPVGATKNVFIDVRIVAASNRNLLHEVEEGRFREDLYYRLNIVDINIPPLRERQEDIPLLCDHFVRRFNKELKKNVRGISPNVLQLFISYKWKGNVRELENMIERAMILCDGDYILPDHLPQNLWGAMPISSPKVRLKEAVMEFERIHILKTLQEEKGDKNSAAKALGLSLSSLYRKMSELELDTKVVPPRE